MTIEMLLAILSIDSYNRGYNRRLELSEAPSTPLANVEIYRHSSEVFDGEDGRPKDSDLAFYAVAYKVTESGNGFNVGDIIISYRGTDNAADVWRGWTIGSGFTEGTQAGMAQAFFENVAEVDSIFDFDPTAAGSPNIHVTGHSLGGGLAGYISALSGAHGIGYDHMPFGAAAMATFLNEYEQRLQSGLYDTSVEGQLLLDALGFNSSHFSSLTSMFGSFEGIYTNNEILEFVRSGAVALTLGSILGAALPGILGIGASIFGTDMAIDQAFYEQFTAKTELSTHNWHTTLADAPNLHSGGLIPILQYGLDHNLTNWHAITGELLPALFDSATVDTINNSTRAPEFIAKKADGSDGDPLGAGHMMYGISYSTIQDPTMPFGNTGMRAFHSDANDLGATIIAGIAPSVLTDSMSALSKMVYQFSATMTFNQVIDSEHTDYSPERGFIELDGLRGLGGYSTGQFATELVLDFSHELWTLGYEGQNVRGTIVGLDSFIDSVASTDGLLTAPTHPLRDLMDEAYGGNYNLSIRDLTFALGITGVERELVSDSEDEPSSQLISIFVGTDHGDDITGGNRIDVVIGGAGDNTFRESINNDIWLGNAGRDRYIARLSPDGSFIQGNDIFFGGDGVDTADYSALNSAVNYSLDRGFFSGVQEVRITDEAGNIDRLLGVENIILTAFGDTIYVPTLQNEGELVTFDFDYEFVDPSLPPGSGSGNFSHLTKARYDTVSYNGLDHGIATYDGFAIKLPDDVSTTNWQSLFRPKRVAERIAEDAEADSTLKFLNAERLVLTEHADIHYHFSGSEAFSEYGRIEGRGGNDTILAYDPGYRLAGQLIDPNDPTGPVAGEDLFLEIDGGDGDDNLFVVGGAGARVVGGAGQDLIFSWSERSLVWGNEIDAAENQTSQDESDMFWWSPGAFIMDADPVDYASAFGYTLTGGRNFWGGGVVYDTLLWFLQYNSTESEQLLISWGSPDVDTLQNVMVVEHYDYADASTGNFVTDILGITAGRGDLGFQFRVWDVDFGFEISIFNGLFGEIVFYLNQVEAFLKGLTWRSGKDPLVLDLDGDGLETVRMSQSRANFDLDDDLFAERTGWVSSDDGLLALDRNADGVIDDISELFGGNNPDGIEQTGFAALSDFDTNLDGVVDASDADFDSLLVWRDLDASEPVLRSNNSLSGGQRIGGEGHGSGVDGTGESGDADGFGRELFTLEELGIESISTGSTAFDESTGDTANGRVIASGATLLSEGTYTRTDGSTGAVFEVIFETDTTRTIYRGDNGLASNDNDKEVLCTA